MIKVEVIENFTLEDYNKLKNVKKVVARKENEFGARDTFECDEKMVDYLTGNNALNKVVVKVIEVEPEELPIGKSVYDEKDIVKDIANKTLEKVKQEKIPKKKKSSKK